MRRLIVIFSLFGHLFLSTFSADAAEMILQPVSASGEHTIVGTEIRLASSGQRVRFEVLVRNYAPQFLKVYQVTLDERGFHNGSPTPLQRVSVACPNVNNSGDQFCQTTFDETGIGAPDCVDSYSPAWPTTGLRCEPAWINQSRTDYIFFGMDTIALADINSPNLRWGGTTWPPDLGIDEGGTYYAGTVLVDVPVGAGGRYLLGFDINETFMDDAQAPTAIVASLIPATILVLCTSDEQCGAQCLTGICDTDTGLCLPQPDGAICTDCNPCTDGDHCQSGDCVPGAPVLCSGDEQCARRVFDYRTGSCSVPDHLPNNSKCDDQNPCTRDDYCFSGECDGLSVAYGTACDDGDACTIGERCFSRQCLPDSFVMCMNGDTCNDPGHCIPATGQCSAPIPKPDATVCFDGDLCMEGFCYDGICHSEEIPNCIRWHDFFSCIDGPQNPTETACDTFDLNSDGFVDLLDVAILIPRY